MVDHNASGSRKRESAEYEDHPDAQCRDNDSGTHAGMVEDQRIEAGDDDGQLTAECRRVRQHKAVVDVTHGHGDLLMLPSDRVDFIVAQSTFFSVQTALQFGVDTPKPKADEHRQQECHHLRKYVRRHEVKMYGVQDNAGYE